MQVDPQNLTNTLRNRFGFDKFREGQCEAICTLLEKDRLLCIQPTGFGKSLLYQLPAVLLDGITLVISPLLALMRDQMLHLHKRFNIAAASINSDQNDDGNSAARTAARAGKVKILFVAPEQLDDVERFEFLLALPVSLVVIDEAHCISTWGHDFRPSYRQIVHLVQSLEKKNSALKVLGLTATANQKTATDIEGQLSVAKPIIVQRSSMDRPNIHLSAIQVRGIADKLSKLEQLLAKLSGDGLIYCATRENTELVAEYFQAKNINIIAYHAGMEPDVKRKLQHNFISGKYKAIAATNALGMGIDKPDLRFVIHFDVPGSITAYYQEVGRSGRDGLPANGILLFDAEDKRIQQHFINSAQPAEEDFNNVLNVVATAKQAPGLTIIKRLTGLHPTKVNVIVAELVEQNFLRKEKVDGTQVYFKVEQNLSPDLTRYKNQYQVKTEELKAMLHYGEQNNTCRMLILRRALGDHEANACGHCDVCVGLSFATNFTSDQNLSITNWLTDRVVTISEVKTNKIEAGIAILDGRLRSPLFVQFMQQRANLKANNFELNENLITLMKRHLLNLTQKYRFAAVIPIPSNTWSLRLEVAALIARELNVPVIDLLSWKELPAKRQGALLNNDQRRYNVEKKMVAEKKVLKVFGAILLLDDYIGSGTTIDEAARVLRKEAAFTQKIVPFTIAMVKWKLGQPGMV